MTHRSWRRTRPWMRAGSGAVIVMLISDGRGAEPTAPPTPHDPPPLSGPSVRGEDEGRPTLVRYAYDGSLVRLDERPEIAALDLLELDEPARRRVRAVLVERAAVLDGVVADNLKLIAELNTATQGRGTMRRLDLLGELLRALEPVRERGPLLENLAEALPEATRDRYRALVREYRKALVEDGVRRARAKGEDKPWRRAVVAEITLRMMGREIQRSIERQFDDGDDRMEQALAHVEATPAQRQRIQGLVQDYVSRMIEHGRPSRFERTALYLGVLNELTPEQRRKWAEFYRRHPGM